MNATTFRAPSAVAFLCLFCITFSAHAQAVLTQHNDNQRTGAYLQERALTPGNVRPGSFDRLYSLAVDGELAAQPLFVPGLASPAWAGAPKDVLYVATRKNWVYAFDVGSALLQPQQRLLWSRELRDPRGLGTDELPGMYKRFPNDTRGLCLQTHGPVGIDSTPVIDPASNAMWVVYRTASPFSRARYDARFYIRKIDIRTGETLAEQPVAPNDPQFNADRVLPRPGLLLDRGVIYLGFGAAVCDDGGGPDAQQRRPPVGTPDPTVHPHGWVVAIDATTLAELGHLNTTPHSMLGGIWQSGYGLAADRNGFVYALTGNNQGPLPNGQLGSELSEAVLKVHLNRQTQAFHVAHFTAPNWKRLDDGDTDLSSGGPVILPNGFVAGGGKQGLLYVFDPQRMNRPRQAFQAFHNSWHSGIPPCDYDRHQMAGPNIHGAPVVWTSAGEHAGLVYGMPEKDYLKAFRLDSRGNMEERPFASTLDSGFRSPRGMPGGFLSLSANGGESGIVWVSSVLQEAGDAINTNGEFMGRLAAFDALDLRKLWESGDTVAFAKFVPPTIAAGKVFRVAYKDEVVVYGLTGRGAPPRSPTLRAVRPVTAVWRNRDHLDLFMTSRDAGDGSVLSTNWEGAPCPDTQVQRSWRGWFPIHSGMDTAAEAQPLPPGYRFSTHASQEVTAVWRDPGHLDLFVTGSDGLVRSNFWEDPHNQGPIQEAKSGWHSWFSIGAAAGIAHPGQPITAIWRDPRNPRHLDLFMVDRNGQVMSTFFENDAWQPGWFPVASQPGQAVPGQRVTAVWRDVNHLDLFMTDHTGHVVSTFFENDHWQSGWFPIAPQSGLAQRGQSVTALWRNRNHLDLFMTGENGQILSTFFDNNHWQPDWFAVAPRSGVAAPGQPVTALWRNANHLDLFVTGNDGRVLSIFFEGNSWQPGWFPVAPETGKAAPTQHVTAVWASGDHLDLFISAPDGRVLSTFFAGDRWLGSWFPI